MKKILSICTVIGLCLGLAGCGSSDDKESSNGSAVVNLDDYPAVKEKSDRIFDEIKRSPSITETSTSIKYENASSNTKGIITLHYNTVNDGEVILQFDTESATLNSATAIMKKESAEKSQDYIAIISSLTNIGEFNISNADYEQIGEIVKQMKTTKLGDLTVSMKEIDGNFEFVIIK